MKISQRDRKILVLGSIAAAAILFVQFVILPFIERERQVRQELSAKKQLLVKYLDVLSQKGIYQAQLDALRQRLEQYNTKLLSNPNPSMSAAELQEAVTAMAARVGIEVVSKETMKETKLNDDYMKVSVRLGLACNPDQLVSLLYQIKTYDKHLRVDRIDIYSFFPGVRAPREQREKLRPNLVVSGFIRNVAKG